MDIAIDEPVVGPHEMRTHEEEHSPRKYHRAEDIEEHKKDASRKPKGQAKDAPQARRENQNTHRRG